MYADGHFVTGLEHATIRDNIVFGSNYGFDQARYDTVVEACALIKDLEMFEAGDMTGWTIRHFLPHSLTRP